MKLKSLSSVQKFLSKIENIGEGGCGISALAMYRWIKEKGEIENTKFVFLYNYSDKDRYINNKRVLRDEEEEAQSSTHCVLLYKGDFIDCDGKFNVSKYGWIQIIDEEDFIKRALDNVEDWNSAFDRRNINKIEKKLGIDLEDIKGLNEI